MIAGGKTIAFVESWSGERLGHGGIKADRKRLDIAPGNVAFANACGGHVTA
jgi:hypothetical protein